jgi:hypothetical protein
MIWSESRSEDTCQPTVRISFHPAYALSPDVQRVCVDDVLRARLKTLGVVEHHFALDRGAEKGVDWRICECAVYEDVRWD